MMKKLVALLMALALLCTSIGAFAEEEIVEEPAAAPVVETEATEEEVAEEETPAAIVSGDEYDLTTKTIVPKGVGHNFDKHKGYAAKSNPEEINCKPVTLQYYCITCGKVVSIIDYSEGEHEFDETKVKKTVVDPDCLNNGKYVYEGTCTVCGMKNAKKEVVILALGHKLPEEPAEVKKPTCTEDGYKVFICENKNCPNEDNKVIVANGTATNHQWTTEAKYEFLNPATCKEPGSYGFTKVCTVCGTPDTESQEDIVVVTLKSHQDILDEMAKKDAFYKKAADGKIEIAEGIDEGETYIDEDPVTKSEYNKTEPAAGEPDPVVGKYGKLKVVYTPATCTEKGRVTVTCVECGATIDQELDAEGHIMKTESNVEGQPEDCTKGGIVRAYCTKGCGYTVNQTTPAATAHEFPEIPTSYEQELPGGSVKTYATLNEVPKCQEYYEVYKCANCKVTKKVAKAATVDHTPVNGTSAKKDATCLEDGIEYFECANCNQTIVKTLKATGHKLAPYNVIKAATCTEEGVRALACTAKGCAKFGKDADGNAIVVKSVSNEEGVKTTKIPTIQHVFDKVTEGEACSETITTYDKCVMCGQKKNVKVVTGHTPIASTKETVKAADCVNPGLETFTCATCGQFIKYETPALGHTYQRHDGVVWTIEQVKEDHEDENDANCAKNALYNCDAAKCETDKKHVLKCTACGDKGTLTWTEEGTALDKHTCYKSKTALVDSFTVVEAPTCEKAGYAMYNCNTCNTLQRYELPKLDHNLVAEFDEKTSTWKFTCQPIYKTNTPAQGTFGLSKLNELLVGYDDAAIVAKVKAKILLGVADGKVIGAFGKDAHTIEIPVVAPKYDVTSKDGVGVITLQDKDGMDKLATAYVRITWRYQLANGDTVGFKACLPVTLDAKHETGTFKLSGLSAPRGSKLLDRYVEVVTDADADLKQMNTGAYDTYGAGEV